MIKKLGIKKCELCKNDFEYNTGNKRESLKRFCSSTCAKKNNGLNNKGRTHTDAWKEMMSIRNTGENNPFYGKKHSDVSINKMSESSLWDESKYRYCNISAEEMEIFDGILISDGSLDKSRISARISLGFKYMGTIRRIINDLPSISFLNPWEYNPKPDIRTGKSYKTYNTKSNFFHNLLDEYNRWYINGVKIIPNDIKLTPIMCYWWFVCDGYNTNNNVYLCTDSFNIECVEMVIKKINNLGFKTSRRKNNRIFFDKKSSVVFLDWISKDIKIQKEYLYKWERK